MANNNKTDFEMDMSRLNEIPRDYYIRIYRLLGENMWNRCQIPTVGDFAAILRDKKSKQKEEALAELDDLTSFTGNRDDIDESLVKREINYTNEESDKFMNKVIASNITDISDSGWFYKKLISSADNMKTDLKKDDCGSYGVEYKVDDITEDIYNFKIKFMFINELDGYCIANYENFMKTMKEIKEMGGDGYIHVRTPLTCKHDHEHRTICATCAGIIKRSNEPNSEFIPKNIGIYSTLMITEHATQASLDSMNNGTSENLNKILDKAIKTSKYTWDEVKEIINGIIDSIGNIGVEARFYEVALMSRFYLLPDKLELDNGELVDVFKPASMMFSFRNQGDLLGQFIYAPTQPTFSKLISSKEIKATSVKSKIMFDIYDDDDDK